MAQGQLGQVGGERVVEVQDTGAGEVGEEQHGEGLGDRTEFVAQRVTRHGRSGRGAAGDGGPPAVVGDGEHDVRGADRGERVREADRERGDGRPGGGGERAHRVADIARETAIAEANAATMVGWWTMSKTSAASPSGMPW